MCVRAYVRAGQASSTFLALRPWVFRSLARSLVRFRLLLLKMDSSCLDEDAVRRLIDLNQKLQVEVHQKMLVLHKQIEENDMYKRKMTDVWKHMQ